MTDGGGLRWQSDPMHTHEPVRIPLRVRVLFVVHFLSSFAMVGQVTIVGKQTVGRMKKGAQQILKGGREAARGVFLIAAGTQKVLEVSGGGILKGTDLKEARAVIRTICSGAVDQWHLIEQTVNEAVVDLSALLVRLSAHRAACVADPVVEASLESIRFRSLL